MGPRSQRRGRSVVCPREGVQGLLLLCPKCARQDETGRDRTAPNITPRFPKSLELQEQERLRIVRESTQNPPRFTPRGGSTPPPGTNLSPAFTITSVRKHVRMFIRDFAKSWRLCLKLCVTASCSARAAIFRAASIVAIEHASCQVS